MYFTIVILAPPRISIPATVLTSPGEKVPFPEVSGTLPIYTAIMKGATVLTNTTDTATVYFFEGGHYTCVATSKYGSDSQEFFVTFRGELTLNYKPHIYTYINIFTRLPIFIKVIRITRESIKNG